MINNTQKNNEMKKQYRCLGGIVTVDTATGAAAYTNADGETTWLENCMAHEEGILTEDQIKAISRRWGNALGPNDQPF